MPDDQSVVSLRKTPTQMRARQTFDTILEAAAQILAQDGEAGLSTNRIAERAGFSIGTIYQYFPNREAIMLALIERERERGRLEVETLIHGIAPESYADSIRQIVRALVTTFSRHRKARAAFMLMILRLAARRGVPMQLELITGLIVDSWKRHRLAEGETISDSEAFVITRAVLGTLRAAVLENSPLLETPEFEDALVRLIIGFLDQPRPA